MNQVFKASQLKVKIVLCNLANDTEYQLYEYIII